MYRSLIFIVSFFALSAASLIGTQTLGLNIQAGSLTPSPTPDKALYTSYKGVSIGTAMADARTKLGNASEKSDTQDYYKVSDSEFVQVYYDAAKNVRALSITYTGKLEGAPSAKEIFGEDVQLNAEGGAFKMVRYPKSGYFISYSKSGGTDQMVMIAIQKM